jgi:Peptidase family M28/PA domain
MDPFRLRHAEAISPAAGMLLALLVAACGALAPPAVSPAAVAPRTSTESDPAAESVEFVADVSRLQADLAVLQEIAEASDGIRTSGTEGYERSVDATAEALRAAGWDVETPELEFIGFRDLGAELAVPGRSFRGPDEVRALIYSPSGEVAGRIAVLAESGCEAEHFDGVPTGAIVLTTAGGCFRRDQAVNAAEAGAAALLVGYPGRGPGEIFRPTLLDPDGLDIPVASVTDDAVAALEDAAGETAELLVRTDREPSTFRNVIGQLGDGPSVVMLGAHLDSVLDGPGINDNGSGVAALLEIARGASEARIPDGWALRIGLWGAEEFGTFGSRAYAATLPEDEVAAYLNLDMAGSVNGATLVYDDASAAPGSERITEAYEAWLEARGEPGDRVDIGGSSDHVGFALAGIPTGGLFAGASESGSAAAPGSGSAGTAPDPCYHIACDDLDNVDLARVALFAEATFAVAFELMGDR